ncbi:MAG: decaprenyl-phosphate phosphoribosyltransferase [Dissulfurispiraceae bacterium]
MYSKIINLLRIRQYLKNLFIFAPLFFGGELFNMNMLIRTVIVFFAFSMTASSVYIFNDYHDIEEDRIHPIKRNRPLASGDVSKKKALGVMVICLTMGFVITGLLDTSLLKWFLIYLILNVLYTLRLKHVSILDVFTIAICFVIRLFVGSGVTGIGLSMWIVLMTFLLALFIALAKRRDDIFIYLESGEKSRRIVDGYNLEMLNTLMAIMASITLVSYIMYTTSPEVLGKFHSDKLYLTVVFVLLGIMRFFQISLVEKRSGSPTELLIKDKFIQFSVAGWIFAFGAVIYK